jgi:hypothetical protein
LSDQQEREEQEKVRSIAGQWEEEDQEEPKVATREMSRLREWEWEVVVPLGQHSGDEVIVEEFALPVWQEQEQSFVHEEEAQELGLEVVRLENISQKFLSIFLPTLYDSIAAHWRGGGWSCCRVLSFQYLSGESN